MRDGRRYSAGGRALQAFKAGKVDLPAEGASAPHAAITLPEFTDADFLGGFSVECAAPPAHACRAHDKHKWGHPPARRCAGRAPRLSPSASAVSGRSAGRGARRLFEPMDLETPGRFTMSHRDSVMLAEDVSALMGSQVSMDGARL